MGLLPEGASFEEQVADYFAAVRGRGLMLSALDAELLSAWGEAAVPFEVVARGIRRAAEKRAYDARPGEEAPASLRACRREVEAEIRKYLARSAGRPGSGEPRRPVEQERVEKMKAALRRLGRELPELSPSCERIALWLGARPAADLASAARAEDAVLLALARALPFERRVALYREASSLVSPGSSARARKLAVRVHRAAALRRAIALPAFW